MKSYPLPRKFETTEKSSYRYVHYGDIHTGIANIINDVENLPKIVNGKYETLDKGDLILADASENYQGIAWPAILNVDPQENILAGLHTIALRPNKNIDSMFLYHTFLNTDFRKFGYRMGTGMKVFGISKNNLYKYNLSRPINIEEQESISSLLIKLNNIITLEQEKLIKYEQAKENMLTKLFPIGEYKISELRFKPFNENWRHVKLNDIIDSYSGGTPSANNTNYYGGNIPFIRSGEISKDYTKLYLTEKGLDNSSAKMVSKGDVLYALYGATSGEVSISKINGAINQAILAIIPQKKFNSNFLVQQLKKDKNKIILKYLQGGQGNLSGNIIKNLKLTFPTKKEQDNIDNLLDKIDTIISLKQSRIRLYQTIKKLLLQNLFT